MPKVTNELTDYVKREDKSFSWEEGAGGELVMTSQTWQGNTWKHHILVFEPSRLKRDLALLYVTGDYRRPSMQYAEPDEEVKALRWLSEATGSVVAALYDVPNQPYMGMVEDEIISYTISKYLETGEADWLLLLPMTKAAIRAMDAVTAREKGRGISLSGFHVTGASKRGWTSWLTAAADERVKAITPMVYNNLNIPAQIKHQIELWGKTSPQLNDYAQRGLLSAITGGEAESVGRAISIIDPYSYLDALTLPKLIVNSANDQYWAVDAEKFYWNELRGEKRLLYLPNSDHSMQDRERLLSTLKAFHEHVADGSAMPEISSTAIRSGNLALVKVASPYAKSCAIWEAESEDAVFVKSKWKEIRNYQAEIEIGGSHAAAFGECAFEGEPDYHLSSNLYLFSPAPRGHTK